MMKILLRCKGIERTIIVTDSYMTPGLKEGKVLKMKDGKEFYIKDGVNVQVKTGHITGSAMTMDLSVKSMLKHTGIPLNEAIIMASYNPAKILNLEGKKGSIEVGKDADIAAIDEELNVFSTMVEGKIVYNRL